MQQELSKDLEEYLVSRYACIRHKFETALKDPNEYKNIPHLSFSLLAMLKNVQKAKPHAEYLIESLESADLKFRAINFLLKGQNDNKKETARLSIKSTLNGDEYFKDKLERMKNKSVGGFKKPLLSNAGTGENAQDLTRNKPYLRTYKDYEEGGNNNSEYQFANKKPKLNSE